MLSGKVDLFYEINPVVSPSIMWFCDMMKSSIDSSRLFPITLLRKSVSQASSNGFGSLNLFGDGFVAKKLLLKTRSERQQRAYSDNPYDIKKIQTSAENRKTKPPHRLQHCRRSKIAAQFDFSPHC